jgi:glycosyltransferase involved in cell wall biosynthesis
VKYDFENSKMKKAIISVIVPIYNMERHLPRCLDSILNQTFHDIEIICINDGSSDASLAICEVYAKRDARILVISQENQGRSGARNTGLAHASGMYIQFCDPDDYYHPEICLKLHDALVSFNADIAIAGARVIYDEVPVIQSDIGYYGLHFCGLCPVNEILICNTNVVVWNKIFRKSIIDEYNIKFPTGLWYEDTSFFYEYILVSNTAYFIQENLYTYIRYKNSMMGISLYKKTSKSLEHLYIIANIKQFMYLHNLYDRWIDIFLWLVLTYTDSAFSSGTVEIVDKIFFVAKDLLEDISYDILQRYKLGNKVDNTRLMALKNGEFHKYIMSYQEGSLFAMIKYKTWFLPYNNTRIAYILDIQLPDFLVNILLLCYKSKIFFLFKKHIKYILPYSISHFTK